VLMGNTQFVAGVAVCPGPPPLTIRSPCRQGASLEDAGNYIMQLPDGEHREPSWQAAMQALILMTESGGPTMLGRIAVVSALNRHNRPA
jgi:hypothetical protein